VRTRTPGGIRGPQGEEEAGFRTWFPGGGEPVDHNQHALTAVRTAPTGRERGQLADRMSPSRAPMRSGRHPTPCGPCRDCSCSRSWGLKHCQGTPLAGWGMGRPPRVTQRKWPGALGDEHRAALAMLETVLFAEGPVPQRVAEAFWRGTPPPPRLLSPEARGRGCPAGHPKMAGRGNYLRKLWDTESGAVVHRTEVGPHTVRVE
jgi:hypothetical protein